MGSDLHPHHRVSYSSNALGASPSSPGHPGTPTQIDSYSESSSTVDNHGHCWTDNQGRRRQVAPIDMLRDDVLLEIFDFYVDDLESLDEDNPIKDEVEVWQLLVHVCQRWRRVVFRSPRRLKLHLVCTPGTPVLETIDVWPILPLLIRCDYVESISSRDNILAALKRSDRICSVDIEHNKGLPLKKVLALMQVPFPVLTDIRLKVDSYRKWKSVTVIPDSFLGGTAPRLRSLYLSNIPFPGLPKLLLSAIHLVHLSLFKIPRSGYIPPEAMVTCLSPLTSLESLTFGFTTGPLDEESQPRPLSTRTVLPSLTDFVFKGIGTYLEDFVARIDSPKLNNFWIHRLTYQFDRLMPQVGHFVSRTPSLCGNITSKPTNGWDDYGWDGRAWWDDRAWDYYVRLSI